MKTKGFQMLLNKEADRIFSRDFLGECEKGILKWHWVQK